ncbi:ribonuclease Z [Endozoicomonas euniceicola]|uniref:Ribonuclease Z n=1 Tax=Endozoicomonas euniceicola TaxID=1234143 RepID=A0ABY6GXY5_9GAMM|nr:ribonuclease Z [Endozoicomonas euniceicola]UYM17658.1 ribonuclease Z [Endozoicomonas euniceicola]
MRLTFLGTSAGVPTLERNVTALALALDEQKEWYLVDCGEGTQHRLMRSRYTLSGLKTVFITHVHGDHMFGLPGLITTASMQRRKELLTICAPAGVESFVRHALQCADVTELPFPLIFKATDREDFEYRDNHFSVTSHELSHRVPSFAYRFAESCHPGALDQDRLLALGIPRGPLWGQLQNGLPVTLEDGRIIEPDRVRQPPPPARVAVIGGDNDQPALLHTALQGAQLMVHEATFTEDVFRKVGPKYMHSTAKRVAEAAEAAQVDHIILTHFSGRYRPSPKPGEYGVELLREEAKHYFHGTVCLAEDWGCWQLYRDGKLEQLKDC